MEIQPSSLKVPTVSVYVRFLHVPVYMHNTVWLYLHDKLYAHRLSPARILRNSHFGRLPLFSHLLSFRFSDPSIGNERSIVSVNALSGNMKKGIEEDIQLAKGEWRTRGEYRRSMKTALVNGFSFSPTTTLLSLYCLSLSSNVFSSCSLRSALFCAFFTIHASTGSSLYV